MRVVCKGLLCAILASVGAEFELHRSWEKLANSLPGHCRDADYIIYQAQHARCGFGLHRSRLSILTGTAVITA